MHENKSGCFFQNTENTFVHFEAAILVHD